MSEPFFAMRFERRSGTRTVSFSSMCAYDLTGISDEWNVDQSDINWRRVDDEFLILPKREMCGNSAAGKTVLAAGYKVTERVYL